MGMAMYGRGFTLAKAEDHGLYAPITGGIPQGPYTRQPGIWGYNEICEKYMGEMDQWKISIDDHLKAPYAFSGRNWIGYEDVESIYYKAEYARNMGLGGAMVWSMETDDFKGKCHGEKYPLLRTIVNTMNGEGMPSIPQRPEVVPVDNDSSNEIIAPAPTSRPRPPQDQGKYTTTRRPSSSGSGGGGGSFDEYTTSRRPSSGGSASKPDCNGQRGPCRTTRRPASQPRPTSGSGGGSGDYDYTTTRRTPGGGSGGSGSGSQTSRPQQPPPSSGSGGIGECPSEGLHPSGSCSTFYNCVRRGNGYQKVEQRCPAGTAFNPDILACDHAENVPGCGGKVKGSFSFRSMGHN